MKISQVGRALSTCAATAMLAGCAGGSGTPLSPSATALIAERTSVKYGVLYRFKGGLEDGKLPSARLFYDNGTLYGMTDYGGGSACYKGCGAVFTITTSGTETVLHSFNGYSEDGAYPGGGLIDVNGTLYGTTFIGGSAHCRQGGVRGYVGCGTIFSITASGEERVLYSFDNVPGDGAFPNTYLTNVNGILYGTTLGGGAHSDGTVFSISTSGTESVLHSFKVTGRDDGAYPSGGLVNVKDALYGTTRQGGANNTGTVFKITASGKLTVLHSFGDSDDGASPFAGLLNVNGTLYGTTILGGTYRAGTVFKITTSGMETVLYSFGGISGDGEFPFADLISVRGVLYGTTSNGGSSGCSGHGCGTVFSITPSGAETVLHSFRRGLDDGKNPTLGLINVNGTLYGATPKGGALQKTCRVGCGTVFWLTP